MNSSTCCVCAAACLLVCLTPTWPLCASPDDDLLSAASQGQAVGVANALAAGANPGARDPYQNTALMHTVSQHAFGATRELLWAGADTAAPDRDGDTITAYLGPLTDENRALVLLVRSYVYLQAHATRAATRPARPNLVLIMENTVNYLHPQLKPAYLVNEREARGRAGVDDDQNGFVDDVYGWNPVFNRPYQIRPAQLDAYLKNRQTLARILQVDSDRVTGRLDAQAADLRLDEFSNPLAQIMGPMPGLSDRDFLNMVKEAAHGSHVAGIALAASDGRAQLHTLAVEFAEESRRALGPDTDRIVDELVTRARAIPPVLGEYRARLLDYMTQRSRRASQYLQATGAGVVNLSFGGGMGWWKQVALGLIRRTADHLQSLDESFPMDFDAFEELANEWGFEFYVANAVEIALLAYENPDVLFVCAAGNEDENNDDALPNPAYLSRFFPNVITVAAVGAGDRISGFSNYGVLSVNVAAPGENILSTVVPEASMYMNGTSMAAPHVAGVAALVRTLAPGLTAAELRRELEYTVRETPQLHLFTSSGGVVDRETLRALHTGTSRAQSNALARMAINTAQLDDELYPEHQADADRFARRAIELDPQNPEAWRAQAAYYDIIGDPEQAWAPIERARQLGPDEMMVHVSRAIIQEHRGDFAGALQSLDRIIAVLAAAGSPADQERSRRLVWRARLLLQAGRTDEARRDVRLARQLNDGVQLGDDLAALL